VIDPLVRPATAADADQLEYLEAQSRATLAEQRGGPRWLADHAQHGADWQSAIDDPNVFVAVAHIDTTVVGYLVASIAGTLARIDEIYVTPEARELGFGDGLLALAMQQMRERGARTLDGESLPGDRDTKNLYERAGIKARLIVVSTPL